MVKPANTLSWAIINQFIGRKTAYGIGVVVDVKTLEVFPIPVDTEHIKYVPLILRVSEDDLIENPALAEHIIPSIIELVPDPNVGYLVKSLHTGVSGLEIAYGVRHDRQALEIAHKRVLEFIKNVEFPIAADFRNTISYRYVKK